MANLLLGLSYGVLVIVGIWTFFIPVGLAFLLTGVILAPIVVGLVVAGMLEKDNKKRSGFINKAKRTAIIWNVVAAVLAMTVFFKMASGIAL